MRHFRRALAAAILVTVIVPSSAGVREDAARLFRDELIDAPAKLGWKGPALSDETRFAIAASGLSWLPTAEGAALVHRDKKTARFDDAESRFRAFARLRGSESKKEAFAFALSLLLDPPASEAAWAAANDYLAPYGDGVDRALVGVLQAPEKLPLLPAYQYAAMDSLTRRASPRLLPLFLTLTESSDRYLRSRAVAALGMIAYHAGPGSDVVSGLLMTPRETSISAVQQRLISAAVQDAGADKNWRVRAAAALALGLMEDEADLPLLEKLSKDRAYVSSGNKADKSVFFPVRAQAAASLARFRREPPLPSRAQGKDADRAVRGGQNVTKDQADVRRDQTGRVRFNMVEW